MRIDTLKCQLDNYTSDQLLGLKEGKENERDAIEFEISAIENELYYRSQNVESKTGQSRPDANSNICKSKEDGICRLPKGSCSQCM